MPLLQRSGLFTFSLFIASSLLGCQGLPGEGESLLSATQSLEGEKKTCEGAGRGTSVECAKSDMCGTVPTAQKGRLQAVCIPPVGYCLEGIDGKATIDGKGATLVCKDGQLTMTPNNPNEGTPDKDMRCYVVSQGGVVLSDGNGNRYGIPSPENERTSRLVCIAADGGGYTFYCDGENTNSPVRCTPEKYYPPGADSQPVELKLVRAEVGIIDTGAL
jgi:hypothetical protein